MKKLFGTDGIRGIVNEVITPKLSVKLGNALGRFYNGEYTKVLIGMDTRGSGDMLSSAIASGASSAGMDVEIIGILPTPSLAYLTKKYNCLGVMISASHNPAIYNGLKVLENGKKISDFNEVQLEKLMEEGYNYTTYSQIGKIDYRPDLKRDYVNYVVNEYKNTDFVKDNIVVDCAFGAASTVVSEVFDKLGIDAEYNFIDYNGININEECGSMNPEILSKMLKDNQIGILFDGDADRCLFVLSQNRIINGDMLLSMNAKKMLGENRLNKQTVVATVMSNLGFENNLKSNEIDLKRTKVGDKYVLQNMIENEFSLGGEQSGHIIFFDKNTTGDGLITALETLNTLKKLEINLNEFYSEFPVYPQILKNIPVVDKKMVMQNEKIIDSLEKYGENKNIRIVLRPSGTEPLIRIMVEGRNENEVENVTNKLIELVEEILDE